MACVANNECIASTARVLEKLLAYAFQHAAHSSAMVKVCAQKETMAYAIQRKVRSSAAGETARIKQLWWPNGAYASSTCS